MKRFLSTVLTLCVLVSVFALVFSFSASAVSHLQKDKGLTVTSYRSANLKYYATDYYQTQKRLEEIPHTYEAWIYLDTSVSANAGVIIGNHSAKAGGRFSFKINESYSPALVLYDKSGAVHTAQFSSFMSDISGSWSHIVVVWDEEAQEFRCYINGEYKETIAAADTCSSKCADGCIGIFSLESAKHYPFCLAGDLNYLNEKYFQGGIQDVALYSDVLTDEQIFGSYKNGVNANDENLILYYDIDSSDKGKDIIDETGNGYDMIYSKAWLTEKEMQTVREQKEFSQDYAYSLAVIADPQYATRLYPQTVRTMYKWIVDNREEKNIQYVVGLGDITDNCTEKEWIEAGDALKVFEDANLEYTFIRGNHDVGNGVASGSVVAPEKYDELFASNEFYTSQFDKYGGYYKEGSVVNTYRTLKLGESDWLLVSLDWRPSDAVLEWASGVVSQHPNHRTIIITHEYMGAYGRPNSIGENIWSKLASQHANIELVLAGHVSHDDICVYQTKGVHGNTVTQMLIDPQRVDLNLHGVGLVAMFYFREDGSVIDVEFYSTVKNRYFKNQNQLTVDLYARSEAHEEVWDGVTSRQPLGSGTEEDPYLISDASNLLWMAEQHYVYGTGADIILPDKLINPFENKYFRQTCDINLYGQTLPSIGYAFESGESGAVFGGTYDGNGYKILNGYIENPFLSDSDGVASVGLFGEIWGATLRNITLKEIKISAKFNTGMIVGRADSPKDAVNFNVIENCTAEHSCRFITNAEDEYVIGGICASISGTYIAKCVNNVNIISPKASVTGGICAVANYNNTVYECENKGTVTVNIGSDLEETVNVIGGILASIVSKSESTVIAHCKNFAKITVNRFSAADDFVGGILGYCCDSDPGSLHVILNCTNAGELFFRGELTESANFADIVGYSYVSEDGSADLVIFGCKGIDKYDDYNTNGEMNLSHSFGKAVKSDCSVHTLSCTCGCETEVALPHSYNRFGNCVYCQISFLGASVSYDDDISIKYYVSIPDESLLDGKVPVMEFEIGGKTFTVSDCIIQDGEYVFTLGSILPQEIGDRINAVLYLSNGSDRIAAAEKIGYSVKENLLALRTVYSEDKELVSFVNDLIIFADLAQRYLDHNTQSFISGGMYVESDGSLPTENEASSITGNRNPNLKMSSASLLFDGKIGYSIVLTIKDLSKTKIEVNGKLYDNADLVSLGGTEYALNLSEIWISHVGVDTEITLTYISSECASIVYSFNAYVYSEVSQAIILDQEKVDLISAIYRCGASAEKYISSRSEDSKK